MENGITKLSSEVQALLQSASYINSFRRSVEELVHNSLDSNSTCIAVRIKYTDYSIQIIDNGRGMCKEDMEMVGTRFATSKLKDIKDIGSILWKYGFRGTALASLIEVSERLKITSRHSGSEVTWAKEYRKGRLERVYETVPRPSQGTTVEIKGLLYNLEIQRKILNPTREVQEIKSFIEHTSILHTGVSFSLKDDVKNAVIVKLPKNKDMYKTLESIYGLNISENVQEIEIEKSPYKVKAFLGKKRIEEDLRLMYLNGRYVLKTKLHKLIDSNLSSVFSGTGGVNNMKKTSRFTEDIEVNCKLYPYYVLFISCPYNAYDMTQLTGKTLVEFHNWISINGLLKTLVKVFMEGLEAKNAQCTKVSKNDKPDSEAQKAKDEKKTIQDKVASIVEKILRSDPKKLQVQNGVKGKPAKRRNKNTKPKFDLRFSNTKHSKINKLILESIKRTSKATSTEVNLIKPNKVIQNIENHRLLNLDKQNCPDIKGDTIKIRPKKVQMKNMKTKTLCVPNREFTKVFAAIDGSVKQRCKDLSTKVDHLMKKYNLKNVQAKHNITVKKITKRNVCKDKIESVQTIINRKNIGNHKMESIQKTSSKIVIREFIPYSRICDRRKYLQKYLQLCFKDHKGNKVKSRYDLLQTLITSQTDIAENNIMKIKNANAKKIKDIDKFKANKILSQDLPILTYESHHYDEDINKQKHYTDENIGQPAERKDIPKVHVYRKSKSRILLNNTNKNVLPSKRTKIKGVQQRVETCYGIITNIHRNLTPKRTDRIARHDSGITDFVACNENYINNIPKNLSEAMDQITEYNFDDEVNRTISLSLTSQNDKFFEKHSNCLIEVDTTKQGNDLSVPQYDLLVAENLGKSKQHETYVIEESEIVMSSKYRETEDSNETSTEHVSETINNSDNSKNNKVILSESIHTNIKESVISEPIADDSFTFTNFKRYGYTYSENPAHNNIQVTFESQSVPHMHNSIDTEPLNMCQAIIESSDIFDTESWHLENSGISKEIQANIVVGSNTELKQNYNKINYTTKFDLNKGNSLLLNSATFGVGNNKIDKDTSNGEVDKIVERHANVVERTDGKGKVCYLNVENGMTYSGNEITTVNNFDLKKRPSYVPKGLSQIFHNEKLYSKNDVDLQSQDYFTKSIYEDFVKEVEKGAEVYKPAAQNLAEMTTRETENAQTRFRRLNASIVFEGAAIKNAKVLRQVDSKFIACLMEGMKYNIGSNTSYLVLFDQHAVDERIRLEQLMSEYKKDSIWETVACDKFTVTLSDEEMFYIESCSSKFKDIGLDWITDFDKIGKNDISVVSVPAAVVGKHKRKMEIVSHAVKDIIREHVKTLKSMNSAASTPKTLTDLLNTEACRFAVKFGDRLNRGACIDLMNKLAGCLAPFQCAHGRPDVAVLLMVKPEERKYKINMDKIKKLTFKS